MDVRFVPMPACLLVVLTGPISVHDVGLGFAQALDACRQYGVRKLLADLRGASVQFASPIIDTYHVMSTVADQHVTAITTDLPPVELAVVMPAPLREMDVLGADVASNRGLRTMVTTDLDAAYAWLGLEPPPTADPH